MAWPQYRRSARVWVDRKAAWPITSTRFARSGAHALTNWRLESRSAQPGQDDHKGDSDHSLVMIEQTSRCSSSGEQPAVRALEGVGAAARPLPAEAPCLPRRLDHGARRSSIRRRTRCSRSCHRSREMGSGEGVVRGRLRRIWGRPPRTGPTSEHRQRFLPSAIRGQPPLLPPERGRSSTSPRQPREPGWSSA